LNIFLEKTIGEVIEKFNFTALMINKQDKKIEQINTQTGVIRSNCFNCIDRTNIAQSRIAALKLI
jgi:t-SNARE complex subunit (syntaxin)